MIPNVLSVEELISLEPEGSHVLARLVRVSVVNRGSYRQREQHQGRAEQNHSRLGRCAETLPPTPMDLDGIGVTGPD